MSTLLSSLGLLNSLNTGRRAVNASQAALHITGRNVSNVNTPGYTRQRAVTQVTDARVERLVGDDSARIQRIQDDLVERLLLQERQHFGSLDKAANLLSQIEETFGEPSDSSLNAEIGRFFDAWESLSTSPETDPPKNVVLERGKTLAATFGALASHLQEMREQNLVDAKQLVSEVNGRLEKIRILNEQIAAAFDSEGNHLELQDRQDEIIRELSDFINVRVTEGGNGQRTILVNGLALVEGGESGVVEMAQDASGRFTLHANLDGSRFDLTPKGGRLNGLMTIQNETLPAIMNDLNTTARTLIKEVNALHPNFFRELTAQQSERAAQFVEVLPQKPSDVKASLTGRTGANEIALAVGRLRDERIADLGNQTIPAFYQELVSAIGARSQEASERRDTSKLLVDQLTTRRESVSGVSLDEEAIDMEKFQQAYQAAARYIQVVNELMDTIIQRF
jgi:flagellar hook-associated protein 1 FlgK